MYNMGKTNLMLTDMVIYVLYDFIYVKFKKKKKKAN